MPWCAKFLHHGSFKFVVFPIKILARSFQFIFNILGKFTLASKEHPLQLFRFEILRFQGKCFFFFPFPTFIIMLGYDLSKDLVFHWYFFSTEGHLISFIEDFLFMNFFLRSRLTNWCFFSSSQRSFSPTFQSL